MLRTSRSVLAGISLSQFCTVFLTVKSTNGVFASICTLLVTDGHKRFNCEQWVKPVYITYVYIIDGFDSIERLCLLFKRDGPHSYSGLCQNHISSVCLVYCLCAYFSVAFNKARVRVAVCSHLQNPDSFFRTLHLLLSNSAPGVSK